MLRYFFGKLFLKFPEKKAMGRLSGTHHTLISENTEAQVKEII